jgi:transcriptional regulator with XRE-family HTH domain
MPATKLPSEPSVGHRDHFIPEWAEKRNQIQADIVRATGADKATVSRWFSGNMPQDKYLDALVACLELDDRESLFRHPDDDWMARFLRGRSEEEKERIRTMLLAAFPQKVA